MDAFSEQRRRKFANQARVVKRLGSFCLLLRREALERIVPFDERFGPGFFDEEDLCLRARQAGYTLLLAQSAYVHHFGNRTVAALGIDAARELERNHELFRAKWGAELAAKYRLPDASHADHGAKKEQRPPEPGPADAPGASGEKQAVPTKQVSLCMIVKNEEENLAACLRSAADLVTEIIVVDTGSTDRTKEIAAQFSARVFDFAWVDDFGAARNECLRQATGDWIFWLDADEWLDDANRHRLRALLARLHDKKAAYLMKQWSCPDATTGSVVMVDHVRLFPHHPDIRWEYRIHEQILPSINRQGGKVHATDVIIHHGGYQDSVLRQRKLERNLKLLHQEEQQQPNDPFTLFNLGTAYLDQGRTAEALALLRRSLEHCPPRASLLPKLYALMTTGHRHLQQIEDAARVCREGRQRFPEDAELLFQESLVLREQGDLAGAEQCLIRLLQTRPGLCLSTEDAGLRGYKARHNLAVVYRLQGRVAEAEAQWREALKERPDFELAWLALTELYLEQGRADEVLREVSRLEGDGGGQLTKAVVEGRILSGRRQFDEARRLLEPMIVQHPQALWPRMLLSEVLVQEGRDAAAAERALREILALDPHHAQAREKLRRLNETHPGR
jgi:tetratricopeptide (TPR) repeat protein